MKKIFFLAIATLITANAANAQFGFGVKAGVNAASATNIEQMTGAEADQVDAKLRIGLAVGVFGEYRMNDFALSADLLYSQQGAVVKAKEGSGKMTMKADYLNIPILANYYITEGLAVKAGIQPGFLMSAKMKTTGAGESNGTDDVKDDCESLDLSVPVGLSYTLPMGLIIDARYSIGVTKVNKFDASKDLKNNVFSLAVGYRF